jgi:hypothetical protein
MCEYLPVDPEEWVYWVYWVEIGDIGLPNIPSKTEKPEEMNYQLKIPLCSGEINDQFKNFPLYSGDMK